MNKKLLTALVLATVFNGPAYAEDTMKTADASVIILGISPIRDDAFKNFYPVLLEDVKQGRLEDGNIAFDMYQPEDGGSDLFLVERWKNRTAFEEHLKFPYVKAVLATRPTALRGGEKPNALFLTELSPRAPHKIISSPATTRNVIAVLRLKPEARHAFVKALLDTVKPVRAAPGNFAFDVYQDIENQNTLVIVQRWENAAVYEAHTRQPYNKTLNAISETSLTHPLGQGWHLVRDVAH